MKKLIYIPKRFRNTNTCENFSHVFFSFFRKSITFGYTCIFVLLLGLLSDSALASGSLKKKEDVSVNKIIGLEIQEALVKPRKVKKEIVEEVQQALEVKENLEPMASIGEKLPSKEFVRLSWAASSKRDYVWLDQLVNDCLSYYGSSAELQQASLVDFPPRNEVKNYQDLNDVGTCLFIQAEASMNAGKTDKAISQFQNIIDYYKLSQAWDSRGWYWSVAEKSQASIDVLTGKVDGEHTINLEDIIRTQPYIHTEGREKIVDYEKYGEFKNVGTKNYKYVIKDIRGLAQAIGEGLYPNSSDIYKNPRYKKVRAEGRLKGSHWDYTNSYDLEAAYFKWVSAPEPLGVRLFYMGMIFEKAKMFYHALRAYRALVVHFPNTVAWTYWQTPWYPADAAIAKIKHIIRIHPELGLDYKWIKIQVKNGFDNDIKNDVFITYPGKIIKKGIIDKVKDRMGKGNKLLKKIKKRTGRGKIHLVQYNSGHWQLIVNKKSFIIHGMTYAPTKIGQSPDKGSLENWMEEDSNENGKIDGPFDSWVDKNGNNKKDSNEPVVGDFQLMKKMGVNVMRIYHIPEIPNKELLREMHKKYGIWVIMGDFLGKYAIGSGATWADGTDYENEEHKKNMLDQVKKMVLEHKDEPYVLMWLLGNENNYGVASNADKKPAAFFKFANEVAKWIKSVDKNHPVAVNNGDTLFLDIFAEHGKDIDIFSANVYRGSYGFGSFWDQVKDAIDKPAFITEYGSPSFAPHSTLEEGAQAQADYHYGNWMDIEENLAGKSRGAGNALGGIVFEWMDEWWKNYEPYYHDRKSDAIGPFLGGYYFEEWFGIVSQGNGSDSPFLRQLRPAYHVYKDLWNKGCAKK